jgi:hypothetical protein
MSLDIWSRDDIRNVILAANAASADIAARSGVDLIDYRAGYEAALMTIALAFGIPLVQPRRKDTDRLSLENSSSKHLTII